MATIRDTSVNDLPRKTTEGFPPVPTPLYVTKLAEAWFAEATEEGLDNPKVLPELPYRASDTSTRCDRALHYKLNDVEKSNPPTMADHWRFRLGHLVHEGVQKYVGLIVPNARAEIEVDLRSIGIEGSGHADMVTFVCKAHGLPMLLRDRANLAGSGVHMTYACLGPRDPAPEEVGQRCVTGLLAPGQWDPAVERGEHVLELKSTGGFSYKVTATSFKGPPQGPRFGHILQGALAGAALGADRVCVGYLSLENLSPSLAKDFSNAEVGRFAAEWWYSMPELSPIVEAEAKRIERLLRFRGTDMLPARELHDPSYPAGAVITDPAPSRGNAPWQVQHGDNIVAMGSAWECAYCDFRDRCVKDGAS